jgi:REP element-mobilizing transposase RayT
MTQENNHHRHSIRLRDYDYALAGAYLVTICTRNREMLFGEIQGGEMIINQLGEIANNSWLWLFDRYDYITPDYYIVMPNHFHGIIILQDQSGDSRVAPIKMPMNHKPLGQLIGAFKTTSTKRINQFGNLRKDVLWQRNYFEHVIRNENELNSIRKYIIENPMRWEYDAENPERKHHVTIDKLPWHDDEIV